MNTDNLKKLLEELLSQTTEAQWLELKKDLSGKYEETGKYISALSNGATISNKDFAYLVFGIEDSTHKILGTKFRPSIEKIGNQDFELWLRSMINPKIHFEIFDFDSDGKRVVLFRIPKAMGEPTYFQSKAYVRVGSHTTDLVNYPPQLQKIYNSLEDWSAKTIPDASVKDLDPDALKIAREKFKEKSVNEAFYKNIDRWDNITLLDKARITINGKITNTAIILLGKPESSHYLLPSIAEITWKLETEEKAYEHFGLPLLLNTTKLLNRIRNIKYKFFPDNELISIEVNKYETRVILEALHNAIAHQDYSLNSRIVVTEKIDRLSFTNAGSFFEGSPEDYFLGNRTPQRYRNPWLAHSMVNLNMIDTVGYGIHTMFLEQRKRFFPLPDYSKSQNNRVVLEIYGHCIDENYSKLLMERKEELSLTTVLLLDRIQKKLPVNEKEALLLKKDNLIEGRRPNYFVSAKIADATGKMEEYVRYKAFNDKYYKDLICEFVRKQGYAKKSEIATLVYDKLSDSLSAKQKTHKIQNLLQALRKEGIIYPDGKIWKVKNS
ncbi:MAG TPA: transcriptional regulator [Lentisphaeria bacterium]|nr:MAG: hypothetical protein A2X47_02805 [Lentisphaerae bacterium GWF2_38_69]HBM15387.1 transcriptional regulator [Lentisphaeria bacterium]